MSLSILKAELPAGWSEVTLGEVTSKIGSGATPRGGSAVYVDEGTSFIRSQNVYDHTFTKDGLVQITDQAADQLRGVTVQPGDVLLNITGDSILRTTVVPLTVLPARVSQHVAIVRSNGIVDPLYLQKWLSLPEMKEHMLGHSSGGTRKAITKGHIASFPIALPPLPEQQAIARMLGVIDDKIASNRSVTAGALSLARALVDRATTGRTSIAFASALDVRMGAAFKGAKFSEPGVGRPLLRIRDLKTFSSQIWTTEERKDETVVHTGDIVVGMDAEFRGTLWLGSDAVLNQRVCMFSGKPGVSRAFVLAALEPQLAFHERAKTGTTVIHLNKGDIDGFVVPKLDIDEHRALSAITEPLMELAVERAVEARTLVKMRDALLPELLFGRIRVREAAELVA